MSERQRQMSRRAWDFQIFPIAHLFLKKNNQTNLISIDGTSIHNICITYILLLAKILFFLADNTVKLSFIDQDKQENKHVTNKEI